MTRNSYSIHETLLHESFQLALVGGLFGVASGLIWMASRFRNAWLGYLIKAIVVAAIASLLKSVGTDDWLRHLSSVGGLALGQSIVFWWIKVPRWIAADEPEPDRPVKRQFNISDVVVATTCAALLLSAVDHYSTPLPTRDYWSTAILIWVCAPLIAALANLAVLERRRLRRISMAIAAVAAALMAGIGLACAQVWLESLRIAVSQISALYVTLMLGYLSVVILFPVAGRLASKQRNPGKSHRSQ